jgi:hypothetical protein
MSAGDRRDGVLCVVPWAINPFRGDKFEQIWTPAAEAALDYGATGWALFRSQEGQLDFTQLAFFSDKADWDRYWYSEELAEAKVAVQNMYQVPLLPTFHTVVGIGFMDPAAVAASASTQQ